MEMGGKQKILYEKEDNFIKLMAINQNFGTGSKWVYNSEYVLETTHTHHKINFWNSVTSPPKPLLSSMHSISNPT